MFGSLLLTGLFLQGPHPRTQKGRGKIVSLLLVDGAGPLVGDEVYRRSQGWGLYALRDQSPKERDLRRLVSSLSTL